MQKEACVCSCHKPGVGSNGDCCDCHMDYNYNAYEKKVDYSLKALLRCNDLSVRIDIIAKEINEICARLHFLESKNNN